MVAFPSHAVPGIATALDFFLDFIATDDRPTFVLQPCQASLEEHFGDLQFQIVFRNHSLERLLATTYTQAGFEPWALQTPQCLRSSSHGDHGNARIDDLYAGRAWSIKTLKNGHLAVFCTQDAESPMCEPSKTRLITSQQAIIATRDQVGNDADFTDLYVDPLRFPQIITDPWIRAFVEHDWSTTRFGAISTWSTALKAAVISMLHCPEPRVLYWGNDLWILYNEAGQIIPGRLHPAYGIAFYDLLGPTSHASLHLTVMESLRSGTSKWLPDASFVMATLGPPEERFFTYYILPLPDDGEYGGALVEFKETTPQFMQRNRADAIANAAKAVASAGNLADLWTRIPTAVSNCGSKDIAYGILLVLDGNGRVASDATGASKPAPSARLVGSFGLPDTARIDKVPQLLAVEFADASKIDDAIIWDTANGTLPQELAIDVGGEQPIVREACIVTITNAWRRELAYFVIGISPVRPCYAESQYFFLEMRDLFSRAAAFRDYSEPHRLESKPDLHLDAPIGLVKFSPDGSILYANDSYFDLYSVPRCENLNSILTDAIWPEDLELCRSSIAALAAGKGSTWSARINVPARAPHTGQRWIESVGTPELDSRGEVTTITGWAVDITDRRSLESLMAQRLQDAVEVKKAAERFTDTLSHEVRNPLSAILQSADGILTAIERRSSRENDGTGLEIVDAARAIILCAQHQKQIVDDVLTLSQLDSQSVVLATESETPMELLSKAEKMFDAQFKSTLVNWSTSAHESVHELGVDHVLLDSRRVLQIIINLVGNAIKFVSLSQTREIALVLTASTTRPTNDNSGVVFLAPRHTTSVEEVVDLQADSAATSGRSDQLFLLFSVHDTGSGMTEEEKSNLFRRFAQGSTKTYKQYGGTGLGLFVSRELAELHGGQIGLQSQPGLGSTFAFYIATQRSAPPVESVVIKRSKTVEEVEGNGQAVKVSIRDLSILLVEDNAINQKVMARQLKAANCKAVHVADHGLDALNFLSKSSWNPAAAQPVAVDIILLDIEMPVMDGMTAARRIREMEARAEMIGHVPIIAITANARKEQVEAALAAGMDTVVTKPFLVSDLLPRIEALVAKWSAATTESHVMQ